MKNTVLAATAIGLQLLSAQAQLIWINEFHYDNASSDIGEFVEVAVPASFTDLASISLTLYNGNDGRTYGSSYGLNTFTMGETANGYTIYSKLISGLQNGAPDGFSLNQSSSVLHFISYEGSFTATTGPAAGLTSTDIGIFEDGLSAAGGSVGLIGTGEQLDEFSWALFTDDTPGLLNSGQAFTAVPEPSHYSLLAAAGLAGFAFWRRRIHTGKHRGLLTP